MRLPVKSLIGEIEVNASRSPSVMNQLNDSFWSSIRSGMSRVCGILANVNRSLPFCDPLTSIVPLSTALTTPLFSMSVSSAARGSAKRIKRAIGRGARMRATERGETADLRFGAALALATLGAFGAFGSFGALGSLGSLTAFALTAFGLFISCGLHL